MLKTHLLKTLALENLVPINFILVVLSLMLSQTISGPECFVAEVAGDDDSFKMVCFNVIFYVPAMAFLSTNLAQNGKLKSIG